MFTVQKLIFNYNKKHLTESGAFIIASAKYMPTDLLPSIYTFTADKFKSITHRNSARLAKAARHLTALQPLPL